MKTLLKLSAVLLVVLTACHDEDIYKAGERERYNFHIVNAGSKTDIKGRIVWSTSNASTLVYKDSIGGPNIVPDGQIYVSSVKLGSNDTFSFIVTTSKPQKLYIRFVRVWDDLTSQELKVQMIEPGVSYTVDHSLNFK